MIDFLPEVMTAHSVAGFCTWAVIVVAFTLLFHGANLLLTGWWLLVDKGRTRLPVLYHEWLYSNYRIYDYSGGKVVGTHYDLEHNGVSGLRFIEQGIERGLKRAREKHGDHLIAIPVLGSGEGAGLAPAIVAFLSVVATFFIYLLTIMPMVFLSVGIFIAVSILISYLRDAQFYVKEVKEKVKNHINDEEAHK